MSEFNSILLNEINKSGLSYGELSKKTGIPKSTLQRYATKSTNKIPIDVVPILESALGLPQGYLMGWNDDNYLSAAKSDGLIERLREGSKNTVYLIDHEGGEPEQFELTADEFAAIRQLIKTFKNSKNNNSDNAF